MAIDGTFQGKITSAFGATDCTLTLATAGGMLTGRASAMGIESEIRDASLDGNSFTFTVEGNGPLGHMVLAIQGAVDGDTISGTVNAGRMKARFEGTRA